MEKYDIIKDISKRTGGDIYLGVVGAVRTGKSTFIKKCIENLVVPRWIRKKKVFRWNTSNSARKNNHDDRT